MKKLLPLLFLIGLVLIGCEQASTPGTESPITEPYLSMAKESTSLDTGSSEALSASYSTGSLIWASSNTDIATVDNQGLVTAISEGSAIITVSIQNSTLSDSCVVTVYESERKPEAASETIELRGADDVLLGILMISGSTDSFSGTITNGVSFTPGIINGTMPVVTVMKQISSAKINYIISVTVGSSGYVYSYADSLLKIKRADNSLLSFTEDRYSTSISESGRRTVISVCVSSKSIIQELRNIDAICSARIATMTKGNLDFNIPVDFFDALDKI